MNVKHSLIFNYTAQIYTSVIGILVIPFYISRIGAEGFGLIGFFLMMQAWAAILDAGIGGSLSRQFSITKHSKDLFRKFLTKFYIVISFFAGVSVLLFTFGYYWKAYIAANWLVTSIDQNILEVSIVAMFLTLSFRYLSGPFRSGLVGFEKHAALSLSSIFFISLRFPLALIVLDIYDNSLIHYFIYQAVVSFIELLVVIILFFINSKNIHKIASVIEEPLANDFSLKSLFLFSAQLTLLSMTWVVVTQVDKMMLSRFLELADFGYYIMAVTVSGIVLAFSAPLAQVLMPRLSILASLKDNKKYIRLYIRSFSGLSIIIISLAIFLTLFSDKLLYIWTGDAKTTQEVYPFVKWLALGNAVAVLMNFIFLLQYSFGKLRAHLIAYLFYSVILIPFSVFIAYSYKSFGSAVFWFVHNIVFFVVWGSMVHRRYLKGINFYVWVRVLLPISMISLVYLSALKELVMFYDNRIIDFFVLALIGLSNVILVLGYFWVEKNRNEEYISGLCFIKQV